MKYNNIILLFLPFLLLTISTTIVNKDKTVKRVVQPDTKSMQTNLAEAQNSSKNADNLPKDEATFKDVTVKMANTDATISSELPKSLATTTSTAIPIVRMSKRRLQYVIKKCRRYRSKYYKAKVCAKEHTRKPCRCYGQVRYGKNKFTKWRNIRGKIACTNKKFGDPEKGTRKYCFCRRRRYTNRQNSTHCRVLSHYRKQKRANRMRAQLRKKQRRFSWQLRNSANLRSQRSKRAFNRYKKSQDRYRKMKKGLRSRKNKAVRLFNTLSRNVDGKQKSLETAYRKVVPLFKAANKPISYKQYQFKARYLGRAVQHTLRRCIRVVQGNKRRVMSAIGHAGRVYRNTRNSTRYRIKKHQLTLVIRSNRFINRLERRNQTTKRRASRRYYARIGQLNRNKRYRDARFKYLRSRFLRRFRPRFNRVKRTYWRSKRNTCGMLRRIRWYKDMRKVFRC